jgi:hypothetical protein
VSDEGYIISIANKVSKKIGRWSFVVEECLKELGKNNAE